MNEYSKKSLVNLGIMILLGILIASFVVVCYNVARCQPVPFIAAIVPIVSMVFGAYSFIKKFFILK